MTRHITSRTKAGIFAFLVLVTLALAGCGNHDQASGGTMTPQQVEQNAQKQNQPTSNPATAGGQNTPGAPAAPATH